MTKIRRTDIIGIAAKALAVMVNEEDHNPHELVDVKYIHDWLLNCRDETVLKFWDYEKIDLPKVDSSQEFTPTNNSELLAGVIWVLYCQGDIYLDNLL